MWFVELAGVLAVELALPFVLVTPTRLLVFLDVLVAIHAFSLLPIGQE
jgi:hypothetical protein